MASLADRLPENAEGDFYVDTTCIDCDTCRTIAPVVFGDHPTLGQSIVKKQPDSKAERLRAAMALVACPTSSIGTLRKEDVKEAASAFPELLDEDLGVHYCGYASESSFGASSYFVKRSEGNILVDSPRAAKPLLARIRALGGAKTMFLTHRDDVADHAVFHEELGCDRLMHARDVGHDTRDIERKLDGYDPIRLAPDLLVIPVPGHTRGSAALLYMDRVLFTGDHLWWSDGALCASRSVCWYSWEDQKRSIRRLLDHDFDWILPGHGKPYRAESKRAMRQEIERLVTRL